MISKKAEEIRIEKSAMEKKKYVAPEVVYIAFDFTERIAASVCKEYFTSIPAWGLYYTRDENGEICLE